MAGHFVGRYHLNGTWRQYKGRGKDGQKGKGCAVRGRVLVTTRDRGITCSAWEVRRGVKDSRGMVLRVGI